MGAGVHSSRNSGSWLWRLPSIEGLWVVVLAVALGVGGPIWAVWNKVRSSDRKPAQASSSAEGEEGQAAGAQIDRRDYQILREAAVNERIQLAVLLAQAAALRLSRERLQGRIPAHALSLVQGVIKDRICPPGVRGPLTGSTDILPLLSSSDGWLVVRYQPQQFLVEVISIPRARFGVGPPMLVRIPDDEAIFGDAPGCYVRVEVPGARSGDLPLEEQMPPAFADSVSLVGAGWKINKLPAAGGSPQVR